jgi:hypothetical protein
MPQDFIITLPVETGFNGFQWFHGGILNPSTPNAAKMIMVRGIAIESLLRTGHFHLADEAALSEKFKISIHGTEADLG